MDNKIKRLVTVFAYAPATKTGECMGINPSRTYATKKIGNWG